MMGVVVQHILRIPDLEKSACAAVSYCILQIYSVKQIEKLFHFELESACVCRFAFKCISTIPDIYSQCQEAMTGWNSA